MIVLVCQEFGQARYLSAVAMRLSEPFGIVVQPEVKKIFNQFSAQIMQGYPPPAECSVIVTGSAPGDSIDRDARAWARKYGIPSVSVIEHWTWIRERFAHGAHSLELPAMVFVNDELAKRRANEAGIEDGMIRIVGNPRLEQLQLEGQETYTRSTWERRPNTDREPSIGFISEEISNSWTSNKVSFTEFDVLEAVMTFSGTQEIVIYLHPEEDGSKYRRYLGPRVRTSYVRSHSSVAQLHYKIVGMHSIMLLELAYFGCSVISYTPEKNPRVTPPPGISWIYLPEQLQAWLASDNRTRPDLLPDFLGSAKSVIRSLGEVAKLG